MAWAPDGRWLASAGTDGTVRLHDLVNGTTTTVAVGSVATSVEWSGGALAVGFDRAVMVYDVAATTDPAGA